MPADVHLNFQKKKTHIKLVVPFPRCQQRPSLGIVRPHPQDSMGPLGEDGDDQGIPQHCNFSQGVSGCQMSPSSRDLGCSLAEQQGSQEVRIQDVDIVNFNDCFLCNRQKLFLATFSNSSSDMVISYYFMLFHFVLISLCSLTSRSTSWSSGWPWNTAAFHALISDSQGYAEAMLAFLSI